VHLGELPSLIDSFELERLTANFDYARRGLPVVLGEGALDELIWSRPSPRVEISRLEAKIIAAPLGGDIVAMLTIDFTGELMEALVILRETALWRRELRATVAGATAPAFLVKALAGVVPADIASTERAEFGPDVHQLIFPSTGATNDLLLATEDDHPAPNLDLLARIVYRSDNAHRVKFSALRVPLELNRPSRSVGGHSRGVTLLAGAAEHVENGAVLVAADLLAGLAHLRSIRKDASDALADAREGLGTEKTLRARRQALAQQSGRLARMQLDLSFCVESAMDGGKVPEIVLEPYRRSLSESLGLSDGTARVATMLERLSSSIKALEDAATALERQAADRRRDVLTILALWISGVALLIGAAFGFFGANIKQVGGSYSIFDFTHYRGFYIVLISLVLFTLVLGVVLFKRAQLATASSIANAVEVWKPER
jgi:hypothetical protein